MYIIFIYIYPPGIKHGLLEHAHSVGWFSHFDPLHIDRRKLRSQTSDNMDGRKAEMDEKQRWKESEKRREEKKEDQRRERVRGKKMQLREKVEKSRFTSFFFQWFVAPEGQKVGSLNGRVRSHLARWEMKSCTPLWREVHFEVKSVKTYSLRPLLEVEMSIKCTPLWREAHLEVKSGKNWGVWSTFGRSHVVLRGRQKGFCTLPKVSKMRGFCSISKNDGRRGTFEEDLERCIFRGRRSTKDMFIRDVRRSGRWFPERGYILEHQMCRFAKMILRDRCSTSYDLASLFRGRRSNLDRWSGKIAKRIGTRPSALHSTFHFWRKSRRIASFLMLSTWKSEEVSQNSVRFWCCQVQKLRKFRRISEFLSCWCSCWCSCSCSGVDVVEVVML